MLRWIRALWDWVWGKKVEVPEVNPNLFVQQCPQTWPPAPPQPGDRVYIIQFGMVLPCFLLSYTEDDFEVEVPDQGVLLSKVIFTSYDEAFSQLLWLEAHGLTGHGRATKVPHLRIVSGGGEVGEA